LQPFRLVCDSGDVYLADSLILATGAQAALARLPSEQKFKGYGVSPAPTCDGFFYRGKNVVVHRRRQYRGRGGAVSHQLRRPGDGRAPAQSFPRRKILQERLFKNPKISVIWDSVLHDVLGDENPLRVTGVALENVDTGAVTQLPTDGVFIAIGHSAATSSSPTSSSSSPRATSRPHPFRPRPRCRACSRPATSPTMSIARR